MRTEEKRFLLLLQDWAPPPRPLLPHLPGLGGDGLSSSPAARLQCSLVASSSSSAPTERRAVVVSIQETEASPTYEDQDDAVHRSLRHLWKRPPRRSSLSAVTATPPRCLLRYLRDFHRRGEVSPVRSYTTESRADTVRLRVVAGVSRFSRRAAGLVSWSLEMATGEPLSSFCPVSGAAATEGVSAAKARWGAALTTDRLPRSALLCWASSATGSTPLSGLHVDRRRSCIV